jgi:putative acetyltransferase
MFLRAYRHDDKRALQQLFYQTVHSINAVDYTPEQLDAWAPLEPNREAWARLETQHCFVVENQKIIVGFASLTDEGLLDTLFVHRDFQGKGIATALLKQIERVARRRNLTILHTEASITARSFFEKNGFVLLQEQEKQTKGQVLINFLMEKSLRGR